MFLDFINIGHLHPLLVHLPIGILVILFILEFLLRNQKSEESERILTYVLLFAFLTSLLSLFTGWRLGSEGGYEGALLKLHKWTAVGLTVSLAFLYLLKITGKPALKKLYWPLLAGVLILLTITGHYGASMTHGENFLFEHNEPVSVSISDVNEALVYQDIIRPIFENNCVTCHNSGKANGDLIMTSKEDLLKGGKSGDFFSSEGESSALQRLHLPLDHKKHMPPNGKVQLTEDQIFYLEWWFENDHCFDCIVENLEPTERDLVVLRRLEEDNSTTAILEKSAAPLSASWLTKLASEDLSTTPLDAKSQLVSVNLSQKKEITQADMALLAEQAENIVELNFSNTNFNDELSPELNNFKNLIKLQLANTKITNRTVDQVTDLEFLESINLYGTSMNKDVLNTLKELKNLKAAYVWLTEITASDLKTFKSSSPSFQAIGQFESPLLAESKLKSPEVFFTRTLFTDTVIVKLKTDFEGTKLFYTLDGTLPDSTSLEYSEESPIVIDKSMLFSAVCYKSGWGCSRPSLYTFKHITIPIEKVEIIGTTPHENYSANGASSINDLEIGTENFQDGNWLGFQGASPSFILETNSSKEISNVAVSVMSSQRSWIFYPKGFTVFVSDDKSSWKKVHYSSFASTKLIPETEKQIFDLRFEPVKSNYLKIVLESPLKNPDWHASPGEDCYVFVDEIILE